MNSEIKNLYLRNLLQASLEARRGNFQLVGVSVDDTGITAHDGVIGNILTRGQPHEKGFGAYEGDAAESEAAIKAVVANLTEQFDKYRPANDNSHDSSQALAFKLRARFGARIPDFAHLTQIVPSLFSRNQNDFDGVSDSQIILLEEALGSIDRIGIHTVGELRRIDPTSLLIGLHRSGTTEGLTPMSVMTAKAIFKRYNQQR